MACSEGDIIIVEEYISEDGTQRGRHSFVVLSTNGSKIKSLDYDFACSVMSSFRDDKHKRRKLSFSENFHINVGDANVVGDNEREGYIKADQIYYFCDEKTSYMVIGVILPDKYKELIDLIQSLDPKTIKQILDNL